jgi:uncharacterized SAM-binding protein YcdF (DUF218 family)
LILFIADILGSIYFFYRVEKTLKNNGIQLNSKKVDAAVIFFGGFEKKDRLNNETRRRLNNGIQLFRSRKAKNILCVGGARTLRQIFGAELMKKKLVESAVPDDYIYIEKVSNDTNSNIREAFGIITKNNWKKVVMVSSLVHLYRIRKIISKLKPDFFVYYCPYSYEICCPEISIFTIWGQIHHEWAAFFLSAVSSESLYLKILNITRS